MKSNLLSGVAVSAFLALGTMNAMAQDAPPPPAPAPAEKMAPAPVPTTPEAVAPPVTEKSVDKTANATQQGSDEWRSTKIVGLNVYNSANEKIGDINDLILSANGEVTSAIIGVGGFLGMGEKLVAVAFNELKFSKDANGNTQVTLDRTKDALQSAPDFKYEKRS
jgi:sporulation protein YlmC with PRC-barrel domain